MQEQPLQPQAQEEAPAPQPQPNNTVIEQDDGYFFPGWNIHVARSTVKVEPVLSEDNLPQVIGHREVSISVASSIEEAKAHIKEHHGKDVDVDPAPIQPEATDAQD